MFKRYKHIKPDTRKKTCNPTASTKLAKKGAGADGKLETVAADTKKLPTKGAGLEEKTVTFAADVAELPTKDLDIQPKVLSAGKKKAHKVKKEKSNSASVETKSKHKKKHKISKLEKRTLFSLILADVNWSSIQKQMREQDFPERETTEYEHKLKKYLHIK
ncbi:uncharacterized protein LOC106063881 isoform X2 [Biomphalaria glabrata]|uniref:Uncharacterized protein LOC106063881 isoform X2 n=1 Tax=Biomphalaria glabrata TaxID=6526 RepID=A0A9W2Z3M2_BIOGL|nr:uncharacterized protein LOC106063881 isoform X2 [Biomphalaria glabrata]